MSVWPWLQALFFCYRYVTVVQPGGGIMNSESIADYVSSHWWATICVTVGIIGFGLLIIQLAKEKGK